jgi:hypothetical protein
MSRSLLIFRDSAIPYPGTYTWRAAVNSVVDGDTVWVERDTGCRHSDLIEIRLTGDQWKGFNADERFTTGGKLVTAEVKRLIPDRTVVRIETKPDTEKYGRWLSPIFVPITNTLDVSFSIVDEDVFDRDGIAYLDLATYLVRKFPEAAHWQAYS